MFDILIELFNRVDLVFLNAVMEIICLIEKVKGSNFSYFYLPLI